MKAEQRRKCYDRGLETVEIVDFGSPEMSVLVISRAAQSMYLPLECMENPWIRIRILVDKGIADTVA